jgi:hypothetical protein
MASYLAKHIKRKTKVVPVLLFSLTEHHAMKAYWGMYVLLHAFLTSALDGSEWSASRSDRFVSRERPPGTHWISRNEDVLEEGRYSATLLSRE